MEIKKLPNPVPLVLWDRSLCEKPCERVTVFDANLAAFVDVLKATCYYHRGCGLAAPQIGDFRQIALVHYPEDAEPFVMVNPIIDEINSKGEQVDAEACLSLPGSFKSGERCRNVAQVRRAMDLVYSYQDLTGRRIEAKAHGMLARIIQHETDHLSGWFFTDRIGDASRAVVMRQYQNFLKTLQPTGAPSTT
jgi:peptide deformylase